MKKFFYTLFVAVFVATIFSCTKEEILLVKQLDDTPQTRSGIFGDVSPIGNFFFNDSLTILGPQLENPYEVENMRMAYAELADSLPDLQLPVVVTSHHYVRFLPQNDEELYALHSAHPSVVFYDYPLDREIVTGGAYYHDPSIADTLPTYQYASIKASIWENMQDSIDIDYEILADLFIPEETITFTPRPGIGDGPIFTDGINSYESDNEVTEQAVDLLVKKAMQLTGNYEEPSVIDNGMAQINSSDDSWTPSGRITAYDHVLEDNVPIVGITVRARRWFTTYKGVTDANGYFTCNGTFKNPANYSFKWESDRWDIRDGAVVQASYNHGKKLSGAWNLIIHNNDYKSLRFATIHRAAHRVYFGENDNLYCPLKPKMKLCYYHRNAANGAVGRFRRGGNIGIFGVKSGENNELIYCTTDEIFNTTCHELGHAAHYYYNTLQYTQASDLYVDSWASCVASHLTQLEYEYWNVWENLNQNWVVGGVPRSLPPKYCLQQWNVRKNHYTPIFIDILDDFNQKLFFITWLQYYETNEGSTIDNYPNDAVCLDNISIAYLQNVVFNNHTLNVVKNILLSTENPNSADSQYHQINELFNFYETYEE